MKTFTLLALGAALSISAAKLSTKYDPERALQVERELSVTMETTSMERNGEPVEAGAHPKMHTVHEEKHVDRVLEVKDGKPTKVHRKFEKVSGTSSFEMGDNSRESELESAFDGITLELAVGDDGKAEAKVIDGKEPEGDGLLDGHLADLALDAFLPAKDVDVDTSWDLDKDVIARGLGIELDQKLFRRAPREGAGGGGGGGGGGRPRGGMGGGSDLGMLVGAEWKGTAKLLALDKDMGGQPCAVIELKLECSGEREMPAGGMGGGRRGNRAFEPMSTLVLENTQRYEATFEGKLYFATKAQRPVKLELEGRLHVESNREMTRDDVTMKTRSVSDGKVVYNIDVDEIAVEKSEKKKDDK
jgi:hypothetical protein